MPSLNLLSDTRSSSLRVGWLRWPVGMGATWPSCAATAPRHLLAMCNGNVGSDAARRSRCLPSAGSQARGHPFPSGRMQLLALDGRGAAGEPSWPRVPWVTTGVRLCFRKPSVRGEARATTAMADVKERSKAADVKLRLLRKG